HVGDELVVALGGEHDERVGDRIGDDAHLLLEDGQRARRLAGGARRPGRAGAAGDRDAADGGGAARPARGPARAGGAAPAAPPPARPPAGPPAAQRAAPPLPRPPPP